MCRALTLPPSALCARCASALPPPGKRGGEGAWSAQAWPGLWGLGILPAPHSGGPLTSSGPSGQPIHGSEQPSKPGEPSGPLDRLRRVICARVPQLLWKVPPSGPSVSSQGPFGSLPQWNIEFQRSGVNERDTPSPPACLCPPLSQTSTALFVPPRRLPGPRPGVPQPLLSPGTSTRLRSDAPSSRKPFGTLDSKRGPSSALP